MTDDHALCRGALYNALDNLERLVAERDRLLARNEDLEAGLRKYGCHDHGGCANEALYRRDPERYPCTCGLDALLAGEKTG
jgi:hypothetical protein